MQTHELNKIDILYDILMHYNIVNLREKIQFTIYKYIKHLHVHNLNNSSMIFNFK